MRTGAGRSYPCLRMLIPFAPAKAHSTFQMTAKGSVKGFQEFTFVSAADLPADLGSNGFCHIAQCGGLVLPQNSFEYLQFMFAIDR